MATDTTSRRKQPTRTRTCKDATSLIADYLAGSLSADMARAFEQHLQICPDCISFLNTYKTTLRLARSFLKQEIPSGDLTHIRDELAARTRRPKRSR